MKSYRMIIFAMLMLCIMVLFVGCGAFLGSTINDREEITKGDNDGKGDANVSMYTYQRYGESIYFGTYPQSEVADRTTIYALNSLAGANPTSNDSKLWTSYGYYINGCQSNFMCYIDIEYNDAKYRGVYFTNYRQNFTTDEASDEGWQLFNGYFTSTVYWFKYEPIKWTILTENFKDASSSITGGALILCDMILDSQNYYITLSGSTRTINGKTVYENNYEYSTIRSWLNDTFYNTAFNDLQKKIILTVCVDNTVSSTGGYGSDIYACANTNDKIFLPSCIEVTTYSMMDSTVERCKKATDYARAQGCYVGYRPDPPSLESNYGQGGWLLRSHSSRDDIVGGGGISCYVTDGGIVDNDNAVSCTYRGVVPALVIKL